MMLKGRVVSGGKEGAYFISMYAPRMRERLGFEPFPGTLNIELAAQPTLPLRSLSVPAWAEAGKSFGAVSMFPARIGNEAAAIVVPEKTHHAPNIIELVSPVCLRTKLKLRDGDYVEVEMK